MSEFWRTRGYVGGGPRPAVGGVRARSQRGDIGETWWSRRFISILESFGYGSRLQRGRHYARRGQVMNLEVHKGVVEAQVQGSRVRPYRVRLGIDVLGETDWIRAEKAMASKALFLAKLLSGEMPLQIEEAFTASKLSLFPTKGRQLSSSCSCPDVANPCKHVAAVFYVLAEALDADPFLVFRWRGRTKEELLENLGELRSAARADNAEPGATPEVNIPLGQRLHDFWHAGPEIANVQVRPWSPEPADELLRRLGPIGVRVGGRDAGEVLADAYRTMSAAAQRRALSDGEEDRAQEE